MMVQRDIRVMFLIYDTQILCYPFTHWTYYCLIIYLIKFNRIALEMNQAAVLSVCFVMKY